MPNVMDRLVQVSLAELEADPHPTYRSMSQNNEPIGFLQEVGMAVITSWDLCDRAVASDHVFGPTVEIFSNVYGDPNILSLSGIPHDDMRNIINPPLRPRAVRQYEDDGLRSEVIRCIEEVKPRGEAEAAQDILEVISRRAVGALIGLGGVEDDTVTRWFHAYGAYLVDVGRDPAIALNAQKAKQEVRQFLEARTEELAGNHDGSAVGHMLFDGMENNAHRDIDSIIGSLGVLIVGGIQEPAHAAANALLGVLSSAEAKATVASDPKAWAGKAFEEGLRWIAPFGIGHRRVRQDTELGGMFFPEGTEVAIARDSANRDPRRYDNPDDFDLHRPEQAHMAFGSSGPHFCMGHFVARSLGKIVLEEMFVRLPGLRLNPAQAPVVSGWNVRGAKTLPLLWDA